MSMFSALASAVGAAGGLNGFSYDSLKSKYQDFSYPQAAVEFNGKPFNGGEIVVGEVNAEITSGFEASVARVRLFNVYDAKTGKFRYEEIKKMVLLGASMVVKLGYLDALETVFVGFVAGVNFGFDPMDLPYIDVTGMDAKGIMMANSYAMQLKAEAYSDAVSEILARTAYQNLQSSSVITAIHVTNTPDKKSAEEEMQPKKASAETIEMVEESDYEFVVKAAKKFNYEFFVDKGEIYFRKAKSDTSILIELGVGTGLIKFDIGYAITGLVGKAVVRALNPGSGSVISAVSTLSNDISTGSLARKLISKSQKVYIDPTVTTQVQADARAASLAEEISYRLGTLECECPGMPEIVPGRFIKISGLGVPVDNQFYVTNVTHDFRAESGYQTKITAKASQVVK